MEWQPIESAPLDETSVDLWVIVTDEQLRKNNPNAPRGTRATNCWYCPEQKSWLYGGADKAFDEPEDLIAFGLTPTHWMPLPEPPKA